MWIAMNDSFVSIVKDKFDPESENFQVRARVRYDLENLFPDSKENIIETDDSDYRFG